MALARDWLRLFVLRLDGKPAASLYGINYNGVFYFYQSGFDPDYGNHSVGLVTMALAIKAAIEEGAEEYDLLHGDERYKFHWAQELREIDELVVLSTTGGWDLLSGSHSIQPWFKTIGAACAP